MPACQGPLVEVRALQVAYGSVRAVRGLDLSIPEGQVLALVGPNGAGKSSVINSLLGLRRPRPGASASPGCRPGRRYVPDTSGLCSKLPGCRQGPG